jgi:hypothetical protein
MSPRRGGSRDGSAKGPHIPKVHGMALGQVIAARRLESATEPDVAVILEIGKPRKSRGRDDYFCPYRIRGSSDEVVRAAYGVDAVQALQLVMHAVGSTLARRRDLRFLGNEDLGFPGPEDLRMLAEAKKRQKPVPDQE